MVRPPAVLQLGPIAALHVFAQAVYIVLGVAEDDGEHELALWVVLEGEGAELKVSELLLIEEVDDPASVDRIASQTVWMPGNNAIRLAALDSSEHFREERSTWRLGAIRLLIASDDSHRRLIFESSLQLCSLGFYRENLPVLGL